MKTIFSLLCLASFVYADPSDSSDTVPVVEEVRLEEAPLLEPNIFTKAPTIPELLQPSNPTFTPRHKSPFLAVGLSFLVPGLGHTYLGDFSTAGSIFGSSGIGLGLSATPHLSETQHMAGLLTMQNTWFYGIYAAYRDVRIYNGGLGYLHKMPTESFSDLMLAPFSWRILKKPEVWGGILGTLSLGAAVGYFAFYNDIHIAASSATSDMSPLFAFPIGIGEESFFRGYLQSQLSETLTPWGGIAVSSLAFGAAHAFNALSMESKDRWRYYSFSLPFITSIGAYCGWLTHRNHSLKESVAFHAWYDFVLFLASSAATHATSIGKPKFALSFEF